MAQTFRKFWIILSLIKIGICLSVYLVLSFYIKPGDVLEPIGQSYFAASFTLLMLMTFPWVYKLYVIIFYIVPWVIYMIVWIILFPFEKCCG